MYKIEYKEVIETIQSNTPEELHPWHYLNITFGETFYAIVRGEIPLEVANIIYRKYPKNQYGIRVLGGCNDTNPNRCAIDKKYEQEKEQLPKGSLMELYNNLRKMKRRLSKRSDNHKYITSYHIDSKEIMDCYINV